MPKGSYTRTISSLTFHRHSTDTYNNTLTVHAYTIAKNLTVCLYWGLIHRPVWRPWVLRWFVNGSNLPDQADSWQGIYTRLAGDTGHQCSYILWYLELKTAWIHAIWPYNFFCIGRSCHFVAPHHLTPSTPIDYLWYQLSCKINYLKWRVFQLAIH